MSTTPHRAVPHASSVGHALAEADYLDAHFEVDRAEYEWSLRSIGLLRGWRVLDAGCGSGAFVPLIAAEVGGTGEIVALDLAPENVEVVRRRFSGGKSECPVTAHVGSLLDIPLGDDSIDAVWCANTSQYLSDDELRAALTEFRRVVRPGGLVAIKEVDGAIWNYSPGGPERFWRALAATRSLNRQIHGMLRACDLRAWVIAAGFAEVRQRTVIGQRWAPLRAVERQFHGDILRWFGQIACEADLPSEDLAYWRVAQEPDLPEHPLNHPDFSVLSGHCIVVGRVPLVSGTTNVQS